MDIVICPNCGLENDSRRTCLNCGTPLPYTEKETYFLNEGKYEYFDEYVSVGKMTISKTEIVADGIFNARFNKFSLTRIRRTDGSETITIDLEYYCWAEGYLGIPTTDLGIPTTLVFNLGEECYRLRPRNSNRSSSRSEEDRDLYKFLGKESEWTKERRSAEKASASFEIEKHILKGFCELSDDFIEMEFHTDKGKKFVFVAYLRTVSRVLYNRLFDNSAYRDTLLEIQREIDKAIQAPIKRKRLHKLMGCLYFCGLIVGIITLYNGIAPEKIIPKLIGAGLLITTGCYVSLVNWWDNRHKYQ